MTISDTLIVMDITGVGSKTLIKELLLVKIIKPLTQTAKIFTGKILTSQAAKGAAINPPILNDTTKPKLI